MDADLSHDPTFLPQVIARAEAGADLVLGSRYVAGSRIENWGPIRRLISRGGNLYTRSILGLKVHDLTTGFSCFRRRLVQALDLQTLTSNGYAFQIETKYRAFRYGFVIEEMPIVFTDRRVGQSKMSWSILVEAIWRVWWFRFTHRGGG